MHTCISSHRLKRSRRSCPRRVNAGNKNTPSTHHPRRRNVTTLMVGLKTKNKKRSHTQKSHPPPQKKKKKNGEPQRYSWGTQKKKKNVRCFLSPLLDRLVGLVVRRLPRERKVPGSNPACAGIFLGTSHTSDLNIGTPVATLPGAWRYRVSAGTGRPGVSLLWLGEMESWICNFYLSVAARKIVWADPSLRYTSMLLGR